MVNREGEGQAVTAHVAMTTVLVDDYDRAIAFYRDALGLALVADTDMGGGKRWVVVSGPVGGRLLLARATEESQRAAIGRQTGGRVGFFMETDDFAANVRVRQFSLPLGLGEGKGMTVGYLDRVLRPAKNRIRPRRHRRTAE